MAIAGFGSKGAAKPTLWCYTTSLLHRIFECVRAMKKLIVLIVVIVVVIGAIVFFWPKKQITPPKLISVKKGTIAETVVATGNIVPVHAIQVKSQIPGTVGKILVKDGQFVKQGQELATIKPVVTPSALAQALSQVNDTKASYTQAKLDLLRAQKLFLNNYVSKSDYDAKVSAFKTAKAKYQLAKQNLDLLKSGRATIDGKVTANNIVSPLTGYVLKVLVDQGDNITPNSQYMSGTALFTIANMKDLVFKGEVSQIDVGKLKQGMPATLQVAALPKLKLNGKITLIDLQSNSAQSAQSQATGTQELFATPNDIQNGFGLEIKGFKIPTDETLRAGYQANATITTKTAKDVLLLPQQALHFKDGDAYVLLPAKDQQVKQQPVKVGLSNDDNAQITSGLKLGQQVILGQGDAAS